MKIASIAHFNFRAEWHLFNRTIVRSVSESQILSSQLYTHAQDTIRVTIQGMNMLWIWSKKKAHKNNILYVHYHPIENLYNLWYLHELVTAIKHFEGLMQEVPYNLLDTWAWEQWTCICWTHVWSNLINYWTTTLWWTEGDIRPGNLAPTNLSYGLKHLPLMSLQHSQWNQSGFMHSATVLAWQITLPCHFPTSMPPWEICTPLSNCKGQLVVDASLWEAKSLEFRYRCIYNCQSDKVIKKLSLRKTQKWTKYDSPTCL